MATRQDRILGLLSDPTASAEVKSQASCRLCDLIAQHPDADHLVLREKLFGLITHPSFDTRSHAAKPLALCMGRGDVAVSPGLSFATVDMLHVVSDGIPLFASSVEIEEESVLSAEDQKKILSSQLAGGTDSASSSALQNMMKEQVDELVSDEDLLVLRRTSSASFKKARLSVSSEALQLMSRLRSCSNRFMSLLLSEKWTDRHGGFLTLKFVVSNTNSSTEDIVLRCLAVLVLDRFCDFSTETVTAPVRDLAAQCLALSLSSPSADVSWIPRSRAVLDILMQVPDWQVRHGAALAFQYIAARDKNFPVLEARALVSYLGNESDEQVASVLCTALRYLLPTDQDDVLVDVLWKLLSESSLVSAVRLLDAASQFVPHRTLDASKLTHLFALSSVRSFALKAAAHLSVERIDPFVILKLPDSPERNELWSRMGPPVPSQAFFAGEVESLVPVIMSVVAHPSTGFQIAAELLQYPLTDWKIQWFTLQVLCECTTVDFPSNLVALISDRTLSSFLLSEFLFTDEWNRLRSIAGNAENLVAAKEYIRQNLSTDVHALSSLGALDRVQKECSSKLRVVACCALVASKRLPEKLNNMLQVLLSDAPQGHVFLARAIHLFVTTNRTPNPTDKLLGLMTGNWEGHKFALSQMCHLFPQDLFLQFPSLRCSKIVTYCVDHLSDALLDDLFSNSGGILDTMSSEDVCALAKKRVDGVVKYIVFSRPEKLTDYALVSAIVESAGLAILPFACLFVRPLLQGITSGHVDASQAFSKIVQLLPLAPTSVSDRNAEYRDSYQRELEFLYGLLDASSIARYEMPVQMNGVQLRDYQKDGVSWLNFLRKYELHGILADDMGLGKTLQTICMLATTEGRHLVVCPSTLVHHWEGEIAKYAGHVLPASRVDVMSYSDVRSREKQISERVYSYVVLDEGHVIRNPKSKLAQAIRAIRGRHRLILTGTPIQNSANELVTLFGFLMPGFFSATDAKNYEKLHRLVLPFIMRRRKEDVLKDLPPKIIQDILCEPSAAQRAVYRKFVESMKDKKDLSFTALSFLRKLCTHPLLCVDKVNLAKDSVSWHDAPKFAALEDLLISLRGGNHRALVFAQSKNTLDLVEQFIKTHISGKATSGDDDDNQDITFLRLDGDTPVAKRGEVVANFNNDASIDVLLLTTQVGGLGLTLTGADTVIFMEHDWNPQNDVQAMDRSHRIGQTRTVQVYRLVMRDMLEERIMGLQAFKLAIARAVVNEDNASTASMSSAGADVMQVVQDAARETARKLSEAKEEESSDLLKGPYAKLLKDVGELWGENDYDEMDADQFARTYSASSK